MKQLLLKFLSLTLSHKQISIKACRLSSIMRGKTAQTGTTVYPDKWAVSYQKPYY